MDLTTIMASTTTALAMACLRSEEEEIEAEVGPKFKTYSGEPIRFSFSFLQSKPWCCFVVPMPLCFVLYL